MLFNEAGGTSFWASINARVINDLRLGVGTVIDGTIEDIGARILGEMRNIDQIENLRQTSLTLTASRDLREVLDTIALCALDLVPGMKNCHIFLYQPENESKLIFGTTLLVDGKKSESFLHTRRDGLAITVAKSGNPMGVESKSLLEEKGLPGSKNPFPCWNCSIQLKKYSPRSDVIGFF